MTDGDDGYAGPAELIADDGTVVAVQVRLAGQFEPVRGAYHWYGRVAAAAEVAALAGRRVQLRTPHGTVTTLLADVDPGAVPASRGSGRLRSRS